MAEERGCGIDREMGVITLSPLSDEDSARDIERIMALPYEHPERARLRVNQDYFNKGHFSARDFEIAYPVRVIGITPDGVYAEKGG